MTNHQKALPAHYNRVYRPLGLSIAIVITAILYGMFPLGEVYFLRRINATTGSTYILSGTDIHSWTILQGLFGGIILIACILAWWGHPPQIRFVLVVLLLFLSAVNLYRIIEAWTSPTDPILGGQTQSIERTFLRCQLPAMVLVPLYVIWYINRAPARAFYRRIPLSTWIKAEHVSGSTEKENLNDVE